MSKSMSRSILNRYKLLTISVAVAIAVVFSGSLAVYGQDWTSFGGNDDHNCVTDVKLPDKADETSLKWGTQLSKEGAMGNSCTPPIIVGDKLYSASKNELLELDKENGDILRKTSLSGNVRYAMNPIAYAKDSHTNNEPYVFIQLDNGRIQCVNIKTMKSVWVSSAYKNEQTISPVVYKNGKVYTGTWNNKKGRFLCFDVKGKDTQSPKWSLDPSQNGDGARGFYWVGAYVSERYAVFGSDGSDGEKGKSILYSVDPDTGAVIDKIDNVDSAIRSTVVRSGNFLYFTTYTGSVYKVGMEDNGKFKKASIKQQSLGENKKVTASPVIHNNRLYIGAVDSGNQFGSTGNHKMMVLNADTLKIERTVNTPGGPKAQALLSTNTGETGKVRVYFTCNTPPGGIFFIEDKPGMNSGEYKTLFTPEKEMQEHCISPLCCDEYGNIYYKNDSNYLMAVKRNPAKLTGLSVKDKKNGVEGKWIPVFSPRNSTYEIIIKKIIGNKVNITPKAPKEQKIEIDGKEVKSGDSVDVAVKDTNKVVVTLKENIGGKTVTYKRKYSLKIRQSGSNAFLSDLRISKTNQDAYTLDENSDALLEYTPKFKPDSLTYHTKLFNGDNRFVNIWPKLQQKGAKLKVKPAENVANSQEQLDEEGNIKPETSGDNPRYPVYFQAGSKASTVKLLVTSENGTETKEYSVTIVRSKDIGKKVLKLSKTKLSMYKGQTYKLKAELKGKKTGDIIKWKSINKKVAKVDQKGNVTALKPGKTLIYVTCKGADEAFCSVKVTPKEFKLSTNKISLNPGQKYRISIAKRNPKGKIHYKFADNKSKKYITIYKDGTIKAKKIGTGQVIFTCNGIKQKLTVKVCQFQLKKTVIKLKRGKSYKLEVSKNKPKGKVRYSLKGKSDGRYLSISSKGVVKAKKNKGTAYVVAKCNGIRITVKVVIV